MLYTAPALSQTTGGVLRPGGLELTAALVRQSGLIEGSRVLDVGCGPGHSLAWLAESFQVCGLDLAQAMLALAAARAPQALLVQGSAEALPFASASFDGILAECVLSLCRKQEVALAEIERVLRRGGLLMLSDLYLKNGAFCTALPEQAGCLLHAAPLEETLSMLERCGFELLHVADHSAALKQLAGQLIFDHGTMELFWQSFLDSASARQVCQAVQARPPGYYALIARKTRTYPNDRECWKERG